MRNQRHRLSLPTALHSNELSTAWIEIEETASGVYTIVANNLTDDPGYDLGISAWDEETVDTDNGGSDLGCLHMSSCVQWQDVECGNRRIYAPSVERIKEALRHITYGTYCPDDI